MPLLAIDANGHETYSRDATPLTFGAVSTTVVGTINPTTAAGATPTTAAVTGTTATDRRGSFNLLPVTGGGAQAAGIVANVQFAKPYEVIPSAVIVSIYNDAATDVPVVAAAVDVTVTGFNISVAAALTTALTYRVQYVVVP